MSITRLKRLLKDQGITYRMLSASSGIPMGTLGCFMSKANTVQPKDEVRLWQATAEMLAARLTRPPPVQACNQSTTYEH